MDDLDFDLVAASLRADSGDLTMFAEVLASKLEGALPQQTRVERKGGLFGGKKHVRLVAVDLGELRYELVADGGRLQTRRQKAVRGIVLKTEALPLDAWIDELSRALADEAGHSERARLALQRLLG